MLHKKFFKTKDEAEVTFTFERADLESAAIAGDFNDWVPQNLKLDKKSGQFKIKMRLPKDSEYQFKYLLNGTEWENDYAADAYVKNELGSENSVVSTAA